MTMPEESTEPAADEAINAETLALIYEATRGSPERQLIDARANGTKIVQVFSAASVVIGLAGLQNARVDAHVLTTALLVVAVLAYLVMAAFAWVGLRTQTFNLTMPADDAWAWGWFLSPEKARKMMIEHTAEAYRHNVPLIAAKGRALRRALLAAAVEVLAVGVILIVGAVA